MSDGSFLIEDLPVLLEMSQASPEESQKVLLANPRLLYPERVAALRREVATQPDDLRDFVNSRLQFLEQVELMLTDNPEQFQVGWGPIEVIVSRVFDREIAQVEAERLAATPRLGWELSPVYAIALLRYAVAGAHGDDWWIMLMIRRLALAACPYAPRSIAGDFVRERVWLDSLDIARGSLVRIADGRVLRDAVTLGTRWMSEPQVSGKRKFQAELRHRLGTLHLDPYTVGRLEGQYWVRHAEWLQTFQEECGDDLVGVSEQEWRMPEPIEALHIADRYLVEATGLNEGHAKGLSLKARAQALIGLEAVGERISRAELTEVCHQALRYLDQKRGVQQRLAVQAMLAQYGT